MIGILDSGSGGLTVMRALREQLPSADIVYFGDIKNAPYGSKSRAELSQLTVNAIQLLQQRKVNRIVSACNSVSASLAVSLFDVFDLSSQNLVEMVGPTVSYFKHSSKRIALCATPATIASGMYENGFKMLGKDTINIPLPDLAKLIEFGGSREEMKKVITEGLAPHTNEYNVLLLACTHYPLIADIFLEVVGDSVILFDPAEAVAARAKKLFWPMEVGSGTTKFILSQESAQFIQYVDELFPKLSYTIEIV